MISISHSGVLGVKVGPYLYGLHVKKNTLMKLKKIFFLSFKSWNYGNTLIGDKENTEQSRTVFHNR